MGDFADDAMLEGLENMLLDDSDMFVEYDDEDPGDDPARFSLNPRTAWSKTCRHCGTINLFWKQTDQGWRLYTGAGKRHLCYNQDIQEF